MGAAYKSLNWFVYNITQKTTSYLVTAAVAGHNWSPGDIVRLFTGEWILGEKAACWMGDLQDLAGYNNLNRAFDAGAGPMEPCNSYWEGPISGLAKFAMTATEDSIAVNLVLGLGLGLTSIAYYAFAWTAWSASLFAWSRKKDYSPDHSMADYLQYRGNPVTSFFTGLYDGVRVPFMYQRAMIGIGGELLRGTRFRMKDITPPK